MNELDKIQESVISTVGISCTKCGSVYEDYGMDEFEFSDELVKKGWRATENNIHCPKCAKKLKPKKNGK